jgi:hypothetical protein
VSVTGTGDPAPTGAASGSAASGSAAAGEAGRGDGADWDILADRADSRRFPRIPAEDEVAPDERADWAAFQQRLEKIRRDHHAVQYRHRIAGGFFGLMASPPLANVLSFAGRKITEQQGKPGSFTARQHELIDMVISFDSGHWGLLANHLPFAVASGIDMDTIRAIRDGREDELPADDRDAIAFIRATVDGTMTDELWAAMVRQIGSDRGAVELVFQTLLLLFHLRLNQVFDEVQILPDELTDLMRQLEAGQYPLPNVAHAGPPETRPVPAHPRP